MSHVVLIKVQSGKVFPATFIYRAKGLGINLNDVNTQQMEIIVNITKFAC